MNEQHATWGAKSGYMPRALFRSENGEIYDADTIRRELLARGLKELRGKPLRVQLRALDLEGVFDKGTTPWPLPLTLISVKGATQ